LKYPDKTSRCISARSIQSAGNDEREAYMEQ